MLRLAAARRAASFGLDESCAARSALLADCDCVPPVKKGCGDEVRLIVTVSTDGDDARRASGDSTVSPAILSSSAYDKSRPMASIERREGRKGRPSLPDGRREGGLGGAAVLLLLLLDPWEVVTVVSLSSSDSSAVSSISRADMERDSRSLRPPSAARTAGRPSLIPFDPELSRERGWVVDGRREMVTFKLADGRLESGAKGMSLEGRREETGDKEGRAGVGGPSWPWSSICSRVASSCLD